METNERNQHTDARNKRGSMKIRREQEILEICNSKYFSLYF